MNADKDPVPARRRSRALVTALSLGGFAALMYAITIAKLTGA